MFKKLMLIAALALPMMAAAQTVKIGLVDTSAIMMALPETEAASKQVQETSQKYDNEYRALNEEMQRKYEEYTKMGDNEPQAIRDRKTRELTDLQGKIQQFAQNADQDLQKLQQELLMPITAKVKSAIESIGKEQGFTVIQELQSVIYYGAPAVDITAEVKAKLGL